MKDEMWKAALGGLLHDVGKFAQRAQENPWDRPSGFYEDKDVYGQNGFHALWSAWFVSQYVPAGWVAPYEVMTHHKPQSPLARLISVADWLSAGEREEEQPDQAATRQLLSIFCRLESEEQVEECFWPLSPLRLEREALFPGRSLSEEQQQDAYHQLWAGFLGWAEQAQRIRDPACMLEQYMGLLQRYTWCVPSAYYGSAPDVSLYDHSRMTAALAACLTVLGDDAISGLRDALRKTRYGSEGGIGEASRLLSGTRVARLVSGDISGVQDFIYTITSKGSAGALRGRSAYLQLLTEAVARHVLRGLGLPITNLIYAGGGNLYLLAPPDEETEEKLQEVQVQISHILLDAHGGDLYLALGNVPVAADELQGQAFSDKWGEANRETRRAKQRRFSELGSGLIELFRPPAHGGNEEMTCSVCHREHPGTTEEEQAGAEQVRKCPACRAFEDLGDKLRQSAVIRLDEVPYGDGPGPDAIGGSWDEVLRYLGTSITIDPKAATDTPDAERSISWVLDDEELNRHRPQANLAVVRRLWVNVTPTLTEEDINEVGELTEFRGEDLRVGNVKPFSVMDAQSTGIHRLGVLRMDLDDAGKLFSEKLGRRATLSRQAALSFALSLYFEGWVGALAGAFNEDPDAGANRVYSIYSGGDDLFFVGSWDAMPGLALSIRNGLLRFTGGHPDVHASAGIAVVGGKYPLYQAAGDAGDALGRAKSCTGKDALCFLDQTVKWEAFATEVEPHAGLWRDAGLPRTFVRLLIGLHDSYDDNRRQRRKEGEDLVVDGQEQLLWGPWMWRGAYMLKRMVGNTPEPGKDTIIEVRDKLKSDFRHIDWMGLAARWADLLGREVKEN